MIQDINFEQESYIRKELVGLKMAVFFIADLIMKLLLLWFMIMKTLK